MAGETVNIFGLNINVLEYDDLLEFISSSVISDKCRSIAYANAHILNGVYNDKLFKEKFNLFDLVHADGVGVFIASKFIAGRKGLRTRFNGSDFYPLLAAKSIEEKWRIFFFGHDLETLDKIKSKYPELIIAGVNEGFIFNDEELLKKINDSNADILIIGLGFPRQEKWLWENREKLKAKVSILVGDGIKVFAGTKKRGPKFIRILGFEWLFRLILHPILYFNRYLIGNPLFLYRIFKYKLSNLLKKQ